MARSSIHVRGGVLEDICSARDPEMGLVAEGQYTTVLQTRTFSMYSLIVDANSLLDQLKRIVSCTLILTTTHQLISVCKK